MIRPNLLFIMTDQQRFDTLGANGNSVIQTPNLDRLATEGANLQQYVVNNPVCVPSRASLFTGRYPHSHGARNLQTYLPADEHFLAQVLKDAGYTVGMIGKEHFLTDEQLRVFDVYSPYSHKKDVPWQDIDERDDSAYRSAAMEDSTADYPTSRIAEEVSAFLRKQDSDQAPFYLKASFPDPHTPFAVPEPYASMYDPKEIPMDPVKPDEWPNKPLGQRLIRDRQHMDTASEAVMRKTAAIYYGMISFIDDAVGSILETLDECGLSDNTIVVFTTDHGEYLGSHGLIRKGYQFYDCLLHVPMILRGPTILPQVVDNTQAESVDVLPTLLELLDVPCPTGVQGRSLVPRLRDESVEHKDYVFAEAGMPSDRLLVSSLAEWEALATKPAPYYWAIGACQGKMIRSLEWKLCIYNSGEGELYDLQTDPYELVNLFDHPDYQDTVREFKDHLLMWLFESEDPLPCG